MPQKILFVDDDKYFAFRYRDALAKYYDVVVAYDAETAVRILNTDHDIVAAVLDVMMPAPLDFESACKNGTLTGVWILSVCKASILSRRIAILLFTHNDLKEIRFLVDKTEFDKQITEVNSKLLIFPPDLAATVGKLIAKRFP